MAILTVAAVLPRRQTQNPGVVLEYPSIDEAATPVVQPMGTDASIVVDTCAVVFSLVTCSGFPAEFFTVVRYLPGS
jgi:hypothetical protein